MGLNNFRKSLVGLVGVGLVGGGLVFGDGDKSKAREQVLDYQKIELYVRDYSGIILSKDYERIRQMHLRTFKEILGEKYSIVVLGDKKRKEIWRGEWENESPETLYGAICMWGLPVKKGEADLTGIDPEYISEVVKEYPWIKVDGLTGTEGLTEHDKKFIKTSWDNFRAVGGSDHYVNGKN